MDEGIRYSVRISPASGYREVIEVQPGDKGYAWAEGPGSAAELQAAVERANALLRRRTRGDLSRF